MEFNVVLTMSGFEKKTGIRFCQNHTAKMEGMMSLSTCCDGNKFCLARMCNARKNAVIYREVIEAIKKEERRLDRQRKNKEEGKKVRVDIIEDATAKREVLIDKLESLRVCICGFCFSHDQQKVFKEMQPILMYNLEKLTTRLFDVGELPFLNVAFFRLESFGDVQNVTQARNYIRLAKRNPHTRFGFWSKNINIVESAFDLEGGRPDNMYFVQSSSFINNVDTHISRYATHVFTVFDKYYIERHPEIKISCGARQCLGCLRCYHSDGNGIIFVNELLK